MIVVIFELIPKTENKDDYFALAGELKSTLASIKGFISVERFQSITNPEKYLSLSFWQDEQAVAKWRNTCQHRAAQKSGRDTIFDDYRLRVAAVVRDYGKYNRQESPKDSKN